MFHRGVESQQNQIPEAKWLDFFGDQQTSVLNSSVDSIKLVAKGFEFLVGNAFACMLRIILYGGGNCLCILKSFFEVCYNSGVYWICHLKEGERSSAVGTSLL